VYHNTPPMRRYIMKIIMRSVGRSMIYVYERSLGARLARSRWDRVAQRTLIPHTLTHTLAPLAPGIGNESSSYLLL